MEKKKQLKVTLVRSTNGKLDKHIACARGLGLKRIRQSKIIEDTPYTRGMIKKIAYLLKVEEV